MSLIKTSRIGGWLLTWLCLGNLMDPVDALGSSPPANKRSESEVQEVWVWGEAKASDQTGYTNPTSLLTQEDMLSINVATTEDLVKYEPSIAIRRRYIGDANGTLGLRGSNMFATARSMVFADGVPLHYFLQTRWNGAPRWTMVSASEIAQVEILYGPFSAEYSGNSMGGVVLIETAIPHQREVHFDLDYFAQNFSAYGFHEHLNGHKAFMSYGDKVGDLSIYAAYNRLTNTSQPQTFYFDSARTTAASVPATGLIPGQDIYANPEPVYFFGDTGEEQVSTDNLKLKLGYDFGAWSNLMNIAYEKRNTARDSPNSYVRALTGETIWSGNLIENGIGITIPIGRLGVSELDRQSLSLGFRLKGELSDHLRFEGNLSDFRIIEDNNRASSHNPADPFFAGRGETTNYDDTGWQTLEGKFSFADLAVDGLELISGLRYEAYRLNLDIYQSLNWAAGDNAGYISRSGGDTAINAAFIQANWEVNEQWSLALGGRYEYWQSRDGYFTDKAEPSVLVLVDDNASSQWSPKLSLGYTPALDWLVRYSLARAYRFPVIEELFTQSSSYSADVSAKPDLKPENGLHHNLMLEKQLNNGYVRVNFFTENIQDAIESQTSMLAGGRSGTTFTAIDEVQTDGVEWIVNRYDALIPDLDVRFNLAYIKSIIVDNSTVEKLTQPQQSIAGNDYPRMPRWRSHLLIAYHFTEQLDLSGNVQYADKSFGRLDNTDRAENVMGAQDGYTLLGVKTSYAFNDQLNIGLGVDNLTGERNFVAHPWPGRTAYMSFSYAL